MKKIIALTAVLALFAAPSAFGLGISVDPIGRTAEGIYSVWLDGMDAEIDSIDISIVGDGIELLNPNSGLDGFVPRGPGDPFSYVNALLAAPTAAPGGQGWSLVGNEATPAGIRIAGGPLGAKIDTSAPLFLANVMIPADGNAEYVATFVNGGNTVGEARGPIPVPEPATLALAGLSILGVAFSRRR